ncbi:MAG: hypothetical protein AB7R89_01695 [Dehalococcoidia bacterium]
MLRLGISERGITEILAIAEHVNSLSALADGFRLPPDVPHPSDTSTSLVAPLPGGEDGPATETLSEIQAWVGECLGIAHVPAIWRVIARHPKFLAAEWAKHQLVFSDGEISLGPKLCAALAVAMNKHSAYWTAYLNPWVRGAMGLDDATMVELGAAVVHYVSFNTIAHGMMLEAPFEDMTAADFQPGGRFASTPGPGSG